jgi:hypothetical protein
MLLHSLLQAVFDLFGLGLYAIARGEPSLGNRLTRADSRVKVHVAANWSGLSFRRRSRFPFFRNNPGWRILRAGGAGCGALTHRFKVVAASSADWNEAVTLAGRNS